MKVYLDNSGTTRAYDEVGDLVRKVLCEDFGNPSSMHYRGVESEQYIKEAKDTLAKILKVQQKEIFFTSGGTESDNWALIGAARANKRAGKHLIASSIEHPAILNTLRFLEEEEGYRVTYLPVDAYGRVKLDALQEALCPETILVSIMYVNNEVGSVQPIQEAASIVKAYNKDILFHVDAVQGFGKYRIYPKKLKVDMLSVSGHKIHGPKGVGFLYIDEHVKIRPIIYGGGQQKNLRPGTEPTELIASFEAAVKAYPTDLTHYKELNGYLRDRLSKMEDVYINSPDNSVYNILSFSVLGVRSEIMLHSLEEKEIYVSSGSACSKGKISSVPDAFGMNSERADSTIRVSFSMETTKEDIDALCDEIENGISRFRRTKKSRRKGNI